MKKMLEIEYCGECFHYHQQRCLKRGMETTFGGGIPSWCPLPDAVSGWRDIADAAGTAATALAEAGYDAVEVFRALPEIIERWIDAEGVANMVMHQSPRSGDLLRRIKGMGMSDEKVELKPCPFCGSAVQWCGDGYDDFEPHTCDHIHCCNCDMHFSYEGKEGLELEEIEDLKRVIAEKWNTRAGEGV